MNSDPLNPITLTNRNVVSARIGIACVLTPLVGVAVAFALFAVERPGGYYLAGFLGLVLLLLWWTALNVIWSVRLGDDIEIRSAWRTRRYLSCDIVGVRVRRINSLFTYGLPIAPLYYSFLVMSMSDGKNYEVRLNSKTEIEFRVREFMARLGLVVATERRLFSRKSTRRRDP
jgi:hypothetical protein